MSIDMSPIVTDVTSSDSSATDSSALPTNQENTTVTTLTQRTSRPLSAANTALIARLNELLASITPSADAATMAAKAIKSPNANRLNMAITLLETEVAASIKPVTARRENGTAAVKGLIGFQSVPTAVVPQSPVVKGQDGKTLLKLWQIHKPENNIRGSFLFGGGAGKNGSMWIVRNTDPALYTGDYASGTLQAIVPTSELDSAHFTRRADAVAEADARFAAYTASKAFTKMSKVNQAAKLAELEAAAKARVAGDGTAR